MTDPEKAETAELPALTEDQVELQRLRDENAALHKKIDAAHKIAEEMDDAQRDEDDLKERAKAAKARKDQLADALAALVRGDVQTEVGEITDPMANQQPINWTPKEEIEARAAAGDVLHIKGIKWSGQSALSRMHSLGKPPKVVPLEMIDGSPFPGGSFIIYDVRESDRVAFLRPLLDKAQWASTYDFPPKDLPNSYATAELDNLGMDAGCPVKVGRKTMYIGDMKDVMCVAIPPGEKIEEAASDEPEEVKVGAVADGATEEDDTAPIDYGFIINRIKAETQGGDNHPDQDLSVSALAQLLDISPAMVCAAVKQDGGKSMRLFDDNEADPTVMIY